jgi:hypothetical protein
VHECCCHAYAAINKKLWQAVMPAKGFASIAELLCSIATATSLPAMSLNETYISCRFPEFQVTTLHMKKQEHLTQAAFNRLK